MQDQRTKNPDEIFCPSCGNVVKREAVFCVNCGVAISERQPQTIQSRQHGVKPSRETAVFVLGLLSLLALTPLGIVGWILSSKGSRELADGKAERSGLFTAGKVMSIIGTTFTCLLALFGVAFLGLRLMRSNSFHRTTVHPDASLGEAHQYLPVGNTLPEPNPRTDLSGLWKSYWPSPDKPRPTWVFRITQIDDRNVTVKAVGRGEDYTQNPVAFVESEEPPFGSICRDIYIIEGTLHFSHGEAEVNVRSVSQDRMMGTVHSPVDGNQGLQWGLLRVRD